MRIAAAVVLGATTFALSIAVACSFPDPSFAPDTQFQDGAFIPDTNLQADGSLDGNTQADVTPPVCTNLCDCDNDGENNASCDAGPDCDDNDLNINTDAGFTERLPLKRGGDWNCDNKVETEFDSGLKCARTLIPGLDANGYREECTHEGFTGPSADLQCGTASTWVGCEFSETLVNPRCLEKPGTNQQRVVKCR